MSAPPQMDQATCKAALAEAIAAFEVPENKNRILAILAEVNALPADQQIMQRMMRVLPAVQEIQQNALAKYGFDFPGGRNASYDADSTCQSERPRNDRAS